MLRDPHAKRTHPVARTIVRPTDARVISEKGPRVRNASRRLPSQSTVSAQSGGNWSVWFCCDLTYDATQVD